MTKIIGISAYYHDSAAALIVDGNLVKAAQEERFTRIKNDASFPEHALDFCMQGLTADDIDLIVYYEKPLLKFERIIETYLAFAPFGFSQFRQSMPVWIKEKLFLKPRLKKQLAAQLNTSVGSLPTLLFSQHHQSHAASAYYCSPYNDAAVLCIDGVGEWATTTAWVGEQNRLEPLWEIQFPHSLGLLYSAFTYYCGFKVNSGEYKLMGLAPYGNPEYVDLIKRHLIDIKPDGTFRLNLEYFGFCTDMKMTTSKFSSLFNRPPRELESEITQLDMDLAASIQVVTEEIVIMLARTLQKETGKENLCLAGGVALNCVANGQLRRLGLFKNIWVQPAAGDAGGAVGAAMVGWYSHLQKSRVVNDQDAMAYGQLGPAYSETDIQDLLDKEALDYQLLDQETLLHQVARLINEGNVVGWFQGRSEFGPRALGSRSILGDARNSGTQKFMNTRIKARESFRPFAPIVQLEHVADYFECDSESAYMSFVEPVKHEIRREVESSTVTGLDRVNQVRSSLPAITHIDYSARIQTVSKTSNPKLYGLLSAFKALTGCAVLVNTSFNVRGEPIVETPAEALRCFQNTQIDLLVLENFLVRRTR